ncbi:hypothetical protein Mycch_0624 [Mycolicibacterium chubuense NBB4]|uniref:GtrA-like protein n=1 Tax=Mycolicibacterium chubuense (strain NBB4) TaxID=710421 RepID=I4BDT5_MYCCN|nr:hypothetical protein [Mycolicibacterium chubuense]AFM15442.1 hypothetical protein Mycch_0624 [Mycolicibacterium chubuense NBB4]
MTPVDADVAGYVRAQATIASLVNVVVNPGIDWLSSRHEGPQTIWAADGVVVNFAITSLILSSLVGAFAAYGARRKIRLGQLAGAAAGPRRLPYRGWLAGLVLGAVAAALVIVACRLLDVAGVVTVSLMPLLAAKAVYSGVLGFVVARSVILRQLGRPAARGAQ